MDRRSYLRAAASFGALPLWQWTALQEESKNSLKVLVTGAHPDDPETGCGGLIALLSKAGHDVIVGYLTRGEAGIEGTGHEEAARIRTAEAETASSLLGFKPHFLGQIDGSAGINAEAYETFYSFISGQSPDLLLTHWPMDSHRDHRICSILTYDAWLRMSEKPALYYYEVMSGIQTHNFNPTDYVDITTVVELKHQACFAHKSQFIEKSYPNDHGRMEVFRGMEGGFAYAEAFVRHSKSRSLGFS
ncbi:MAG: PIG-L family deacetylase [Lewinellaceae bacterium]|nr:PIG-L family deacetylase [Lewinellaceae bacterium]